MIGCIMRHRKRVAERRVYTARLSTLLLHDLVQVQHFTQVVCRHGYLGQLGRCLVWSEVTLIIGTGNAMLTDGVQSYAWIRLCRSGNVVTGSDIPRSVWARGWSRCRGGTSWGVRGRAARAGGRQWHGVMVMVDLGVLHLVLIAHSPTDKVGPI